MKLLHRSSWPTGRRGWRILENRVPGRSLGAVVVASALAVSGCGTEAPAVVSMAEGLGAASAAGTVLLGGAAVAGAVLVATGADEELAKANRRRLMQGLQAKLEDGNRVSWVKFSERRGYRFRETRTTPDSPYWGTAGDRLPEPKTIHWWLPAEYVQNPEGLEVGDPHQVTVEGDSVVLRPRS